MTRTTKENYSIAYDYARTFADDEKVFWQVCLLDSIPANIIDNAWQSRQSYSKMPSSRGIAACLIDSALRGDVKTSMRVYSTTQLASAYEYLYFNHPRFNRGLIARDVVMATLEVCVFVPFNKNIELISEGI